jgi:hypothetical protein
MGEEVGGVALVFLSSVQHGSISLVSFSFWMCSRVVVLDRVPFPGHILIAGNTLCLGLFPTGSLILHFLMLLG